MNDATANRYGLMARFGDAHRLIEATRRARREYVGLEAFSPFPMPELHRALDTGADRLGGWALGGGLVGALGSYLIQYYTAVIDYPMNVGGRPPFSWPAFLPVSVVLGLLCAAFGTLLGLFLSSRLPRLYHPVFNVDEFAAASRDGFFLLIRADDPAFDPQGTHAFLLELGAETIREVTR